MCVLALRLEPHVGEDANIQDLCKSMEGHLFGAKERLWSCTRGGKRMHESVLVSAICVTIVVLMLLLTAFGWSLGRFEESLRIAGSAADSGVMYILRKLYMFL